ncbi:hypothetical protein D9M71_60260 [compost metagenome]
MGGAVDRLHAGVSQERNLISHLDLLRRPGHGRRDVTLGAGLDAIGHGRLLDGFQHAGAGNLGVLPLVPLDRERCQPLARGSHVVGDHRHRVPGVHHFVHALDHHGRCLVHRVEGAADDRADGDRRDLHALGAGIDTEHGLAAHLVGAVGAFGRSANQLEPGRVFQLRLSGRGQPGGSIHQFAVTELATAFRMQHHAVLGLAAFHRHRPLLRGSRHQQGARGGAGLAQGFPVGRHRGRTAGDLEAQHGVGIARVVGWSVLDHHLIEGYFQFLGDQRRHRGVGGLAHLHRLNDEEHLAAAIDADIGVGVEFTLGGLGVAHQARQGEADQQAAPHGGAGLEKAPAAERGSGERGHVVHAAPSPLADCASAATLMASRMRR